jgi:phosphoglycolate phosphatase
MIRKLILFDLDWTLIFTGGAGVRALDHAFEKAYGISHAMKAVNPDGKTDPAICREMIQVHLRRESKPEEILALCRGYVDRLKVEIPISPGYRVLPGITALLEALRHHPEVILGLGTGNLEEGAKIKLDRADLFKYFKFGGYGSDAEPRPEVLRFGVRRGEALAQRSFEAKDVLVIGDNVRDIAAGKAIGATTMAVASGPMSYDDLAATRPDSIFHDLSATEKVLETILR